MANKTKDECLKALWLCSLGDERIGKGHSCDECAYKCYGYGEPEYKETNCDEELFKDAYEYLSASEYSNNDEEVANSFRKRFTQADIIIENRKNGVQPAMFVLENGRVNMVTITPDQQFCVTDEGTIGERYNELGEWCGA